MAIEHILTDASSAMTVISLITFVGILWWAFSSNRKRDFAEAARLPFADDDIPADADAANLQARSAREQPHG